MNRYLMMITLFFAFIGLSQAKEKSLSYQVEWFKGSVQVNGTQVKKKQILRRGELLQTLSKSIVKISNLSDKRKITLGPESKLRIPIKEQNPVTLQKGTLRWISGKVIKKLSDGKKNMVVTQNASMGVRGTDFFIKYGPLLNESEIVVFSGEVLFKSNQNKSDKVSLKERFWGGIGGRYGEKIGKTIKLPDHIVRHFQQSLPR
jgi:hypothetical protein